MPSNTSPCKSGRAQVTSPRSSYSASGSIWSMAGAVSLASLPDRAFAVAVDEHFEVASVVSPVRPDLVEHLCDALTLFGEDRKSTRLNSSHANISYAVF